MSHELCPGDEGAVRRDLYASMSRRAHRDGAKGPVHLAGGDLGSAVADGGDRYARGEERA